MTANKYRVNHLLSIEAASCSAPHVNYFYWPNTSTLILSRRAYIMQPKALHHIQLSTLILRVIFALAWQNES